jgi:hypothetical protein
MEGENFDSWLWFFRKIKIAIVEKVAWVKEEKRVLIDCGVWAGELKRRNEREISTETVGGKMDYTK